MLFDPLAFDTITAGDAATARELADLYREDSADLLRGLEVAGQSGSEDEVRRFAHTLKSTSATVGAKLASQLAARIELEGLTVLPALQEKLREHVASAIAAMQEHLGVAAR